MYINKSRNLPMDTGTKIGGAERQALSLMTSRVYRFRVRHPRWYALIAFLIGGALLGGFTISTYGTWAYESINLAGALWRVVCGSIGGGLAMVALAFAYASSLRRTLRPLADAGLADSGPAENAA